MVSPEQTMSDFALSSRVSIRYSIKLFPMVFLNSWLRYEGLKLYFLAYSARECFFSG